MQTITNGKCAVIWCWDCDLTIVDYCLVDTPEHLIGIWTAQLHIVSHIDPEKRVKSFVFERDEQKEQRIKERCEQLQKYFELLKQRLKV